MIVCREINVVVLLLHEIKRVNFVLLHLLLLQLLGLLVQTLTGKYVPLVEDAVPGIACFMGDIHDLFLADVVPGCLLLARLAVIHPLGL